MKQYPYPRVVWPSLNPIPDSAFSQPREWSKEVLHICCDDYLGIRSAAAALPGQVLVLPNEAWDYAKHLPEVLDIMRKVGRLHVVVHGMSNSIFEASQAIARFGLSSGIFGVWHGGVAQLVDPIESMHFGRFLAMDREGIFRRSHIMKKGANSLLEHAANCDLLNCPPRRQDGKAIGVRLGSVIVPGTWPVYKNTVGGLVASEMASRVLATSHYLDVSDLSIPLAKAQQLKFSDPVTHLAVLQEHELAVNVSFMEAHSMVDMECISVGRFSIHADHGLEPFGDHPYAHYTTVSDPGDVSALADQINLCLEIPLNERTEIAIDYAQLVETESLARWEMFLDL